MFDGALRESTNPISLSIDMKIQYAVRDGLQKSINEFNAVGGEFNAVGGAAVVMNISNGEIISLVSLPYFAPNKKLGQNGKFRFNMITSSAKEPRTSEKIFKASMALEMGKITSFTQFDARFPLKVGRFIIHDFKGKATILSVEEIKIFIKYRLWKNRKGNRRITISYGHGIAVNPLYLINVFSGIMNDDIMNNQIFD